jgi:hypothetical protein
MGNGAFFKHKGELNSRKVNFLSDLVYISLKAEWDGMLISDQFLWPRENNRAREMKEFALILLSDYLRAEIHNY